MDFAISSQNKSLYTRSRLLKEIPCRLILSLVLVALKLLNFSGNLSGISFERWRKVRVVRRSFSVYMLVRKTQVALG